MPSSRTPTGPSCPTATRTCSRCSPRYPTLAIRRNAPPGDRCPRGGAGGGDRGGEVVRRDRGWVAAAPVTLAELGVAGAARPVESPIRRVFARLDADVFDRLPGAVLWTRTGVVDGRRVIAIDGKTVRGVRRRGHGGDTERAAPHLVAALDHAAGAVLGQLEVERRATRSSRCAICSRVSTPPGPWFAAGTTTNTIPADGHVNVDVHTATTPNSNAPTGPMRELRPMIPGVVTGVLPRLILETGRPHIALNDAGRASTPHEAPFGHHEPRPSCVRNGRDRVSEPGDARPGSCGLWRWPRT